MDMNHAVHRNRSLALPRCSVPNLARVAMGVALLSSSACSGQTAFTSTNCAVRDITAISTYSVEAWGIPDNSFAVGEALRLQIRTAAPAYVTMFHVSSSCEVTRLLDNARIPNATIIDYPPQGSGIQVAVGPPDGAEGFYIIATLDELTFLSPGDILSESGDIASLNMSPAQFYQRLEQARARMNPAEWGLTTLRTEVVEH